VTLKLRYSDFETVTRSRTASGACREKAQIEASALELLEKTDYRERAVRLLGLGMSALVEEDGPVQLLLFESDPEACLSGGEATGE